MANLNKDLIKILEDDNANLETVKDCLKCALKQIGYLTDVIHQQSELNESFVKHSTTQAEAFKTLYSHLITNTVSDHLEKEIKASSFKKTSPKI